MRTVALSILLATAAGLASAANAQETPAVTPVGPPASSYGPVVDSGPAQQLSWNGDGWRNSDVNAQISRYDIRYGVVALKDQDFTEAEEIFANFLRYKQNSADANFYMGVAKMNLGKWEDAKPYLEIAVRKKPKHPDPKSRLGVTYAKLGDTAGANAQRADLVKMNDACKGACRLSPYIMSGIQMIDEALAQTPAPKPAALG
jgi:TolA-binding protein